MKTTLLLIAISALCRGIPLESTTIKSFSTTNKNLYVLSALGDHEEVPSNGIEIKPDKQHTDQTDDHFFKKKIIALPLSEVTSNTQVLTNEHGHAIVAHSTDSSNEDMDTAESSIVFRPLFTYRKQEQQRKRFYIPSKYYNCHGETTPNPNYVSNWNRRKHMSAVSEYNRPYRNTMKTSYPEWYQKAELPALL